MPCVGAAGQDGVSRIAVPDPPSDALCGFWARWSRPFHQIGAILAAGVLVFLVRKHRPAFWLTLLAVLFLAAGLAAYFAFVEPANVEMKGWTLAVPPTIGPAGGTGGSTGTRPILSFILWDSARWSFR